MNKLTKKIGGPFLQQFEPALCYECNKWSILFEKKEHAAGSTQKSFWSNPYLLESIKYSRYNFQIISKYRGSSPYVNFISANLITAVFKTFQNFALCDFYVLLANAILGLMRFYVIFISLLRSICLMRFLANATFSRSQKSH